MNIYGRDLRIGDVLSVWWTPGRDTVIGLRPYPGPIAGWDDVQIAAFALLPSREMTIFPREIYEAIHRKED